MLGEVIARWTGFVAGHFNFAFIADEEWRMGVVAAEGIVPDRFRYTHHMLLVAART